MSAVEADEGFSMLRPEHQGIGDAVRSLQGRCGPIYAELDHVALGGFPSEAVERQQHLEISVVHQLTYTQQICYREDV